MHYHKLNQAITPITASILETVCLFEQIIKASGTWYAAGIGEFLCILLPGRGRWGCKKPFRAVEQVTQGRSSKHACADT